MKEKYKKIIVASSFFTGYVVLLNLFAFGMIEATKHLGISKYNILITPIIVFILIIPFHLWFKDANSRAGESFTSTFGLIYVKKTKLLDAVAIGASSYVLISFLSVIAKMLLPAVPPQPEVFSYENITNSVPFFISFIGFVILPPISEELLFRGFIFKILEKQSPLFRVIFTSFLFALFHFDVYNLALPLMLGILLGVLREETKSIYPSIIAHASANLTGLLFMAKLSKYLDSNIAFGILLAISLLVFVAFMNKYDVFKYTKEYDLDDNVLTYELLESPIEKENKEGIVSFLPLTVPIAYFVTLSVLTLHYASSIS